MSKKLISKTDYHGFESLYDSMRDFDETFDERFNPNMKGIPGEFTGTMRVTVEYFPDGVEEVEASTGLEPVLAD